MKDTLIIAGRAIKNRLFVGTGKFPRKSIVKDVLETIKADVVTVSLRRVDLDSQDENILEFVPKSSQLMVNTSGARTAEEAIRIARLSKACGGDGWIKIEVISDSKYLLPDNEETIKATEVLAKEGFKVFPYMTPDLYDAKRLVDAGAVAVMPLGSPIGSNRGIKTKELVQIIINEVKAPIIVDAGLGMPSEAAECMEMGCAAVLVNTAIATAKNQVLMAEGFSEAVKAGRKAFLAKGNQAEQIKAHASSPLTGFLHEK
ncbi:MAG: thiazole synthase [PVC group bacterium]|nr:thiazole synthase [PVC group bacterium]